MKPVSEIASEIFDKTAGVELYPDKTHAGASFFCGCYEGDLGDCFEEARKKIIEAISKSSIYCKNNSFLPCAINK